MKYSILIPAYNAEKYIERSINSVLNQKTKYDYEIIICDDGSTDNTVKIINEIKSDKIKLIKNEENKRCVITRKRLLLESQGDYILWLDADDEYSPKTLSILDEYVSDNKYDIIELSLQYIYSNGERSFLIRENKTICEENLLDLFFYKNPKWVLWGAAFKRDVALRKLPPDFNYIMDDVFFTLPIYYYSKNYISINSEPLYFYNYGIGYWTGDFYEKERMFTYDEFVHVLENRKSEFDYNYHFLRENNADEKYLYPLIEACDLYSLVHFLIKINDFQERKKALNIFNNYFNLYLSPKIIIEIMK